MSYRRRPLDRTSAVRDASIIVIATEGSRTEQIYFKALCSKEFFHSKRVNVEVIEREDPSLSSPQHVIAEIEKFRSAYNWGEDDSFWLVIDTDNWGGRQLGSVNQQCKQKGYKLAVSKPFFEVWLLYHFEQNLRQISDPEEIIAKLKHCTDGYKKNNLQFKKFSKYVESAIENAKAEDCRADWPTDTGSHVYKLVDAILEFWRKDQNI